MQKEKHCKPRDLLYITELVPSSQKKCGIKYALYQGEIASVDCSAETRFSKVAKQIIDEGGYTLDQVFNCDETGVHWKNHQKLYTFPNKLPLARLRRRFTVLLISNVFGDFKMKPVIIYKHAKSHSYCNNLPNCALYNNSSGYMTTNLSLK